MNAIFIFIKQWIDCDQIIVRMIEDGMIKKKKLKRFDEEIYDGFLFLISTLIIKD